MSGAKRNSKWRQFKKPGSKSPSEICREYSRHCGSIWDILKESLEKVPDAVLKVAVDEEVSVGDTTNSTG